jgi:hypothetical protein
MTGTLRGVECAGQAVAYGIKSSNTTDWLSIGLNVGLSEFSLLTLHIMSTYQHLISCAFTSIRLDGDPQDRR